MKKKLFKVGIEFKNNFNEVVKAEDKEEAFEIVFENSKFIKNINVAEVK